MTTITRCPDCGSTLAPDAPMGLCVRCLLALEALASPAPNSGEAVRFGDYELLDAGKPGGMGRVYRARHAGLDRIVALKMINAGFLPTAQEKDRFRAEAHAAGSLDHPHIVPLHEVGEHGGRGFFTMKWMEGGSLAERIARQQMSHRAAAEILTVISRAVHFAHQRGIIHRDLKPSNILLDGQGQPHVTDFGLAKRVVGTGSTSSDSSSDKIADKVEHVSTDYLTVTGAIIGTPAYMSPEQAAGKAREVTTAADVYSLGAILYELLAGQPPFVGETPLEILRKVVEEEPVPPNQCLRSSRRKEAHSETRTPKSETDQSLPSLAAAEAVDGDLETICLKCLEKDPARRYGSAEALADDLGRWLRREPILARPGGPLTRLTKWVRRRPVVAGLTAVLIATFISGFVIVLWKQHQTEQARRQAVASVEKTLEAITRYLVVAEDQPQWRSIKDMVSRNHEMRKALLQITVPFLDELAAPIGKDAGLAYRRAGAYRRVAEWQSLLGLTPDAITNAQRAQRIFQDLAVVQPRSSQPRRERADTGSLLARLLWLPGLGPEAETVHRQTIILNEQLAADFPKEPLHRLKLAMSRGDYATFLCDPHLYPIRSGEGMALYEKVLGEFKRLQATDPNSMEVKRAFPRAILNVETHLAEMTSTEATCTNRLLQALSLARELVQHDALPLDDQALLGGLLSLLGEHQLRSGHWTDAERSLREAAAVWDKLVEEAPTETPLHWGQATAYERLARLLLATGRWSEGEQMAEVTTDSLERHLGRFPFDFLTRVHLTVSYEARSRVYRDADRRERALELWRKALAHRERLIRDEPGRIPWRASLAASQCELAKLLLQDSQFTEARNLFFAALQHYQHLAQLYPKDETWGRKAQETEAHLERLRASPANP